MTTRIIYIADDEEEFETEEECLEHERSMKPDGAVILFDDKMHPMVEGDATERYERTMFIYIIDSEKAKPFFDWIRSYSGYEVPHDFSDRDLFYYNEDDDRYEDFLKKVKEMDEQRDILMEHIERVSK